MSELTLDRLRSLLNFDPKTGVFTRAVNTHGGRWKAGDKVGCKAQRDGITYLRLCIDRRFYYAHRLAWFYVHGEWANEVDHINGDGLDNRLLNLRNANHSENLCNRGKNTNNTSGFKGVWWARRERKWCADIWHLNRKIHIGTFPTREAAAAAYALAAERYHGQFARTE